MTAEVRPLTLEQAVEAAGAAHIDDSGCWLSRVSITVTRRVGADDVDTEYRWELA